MRNYEQSPDNLHVVSRGSVEMLEPGEETIGRPSRKHLLWLVPILITFHKPEERAVVAAAREYGEFLGLSVEIVGIGD